MATVVNGDVEHVDGKRACVELRVTRASGVRYMSHYLAISRLLAEKGVGVGGGPGRGGEGSRREGGGGEEKVLREGSGWIRLRSPKKFNRPDIGHMTQKIIQSFYSQFQSSVEIITREVRGRNFSLKHRLPPTHGTHSSSSIRHPKEMSS